MMRFRDSLGAAGLYVLVVILIPLLILAGFGLVWLYEHQQLLPVMVGWLLIGVIGWVAWMVWPRRRFEQLLHEQHSNNSPDQHSALPLTLPPRNDWSDRERAAWQQMCAYSEGVLKDQPRWEDLPELALEHLARTAAIYHGEREKVEYRFTIPEALLVISEASARYRLLLLDHLPFVERVRVNTVLSLYEHQERLQQGLRWTRNARRVARLSNPITALVGELRDQIGDRLLEQASTSLQTDLKRLLLQEVSQVAIDLYSGRLKISQAELAQHRSAAWRADQQRMAAAVEPLRVVLVGQSGAGKSSLINALTGSLRAETDALPSTDAETAHVFDTDAGTRLHLIDTAGLDGTEARHDDALTAMIDADLIVLVLRATQPSRGPDHQLLDALADWFTRQPERRLPPLLVVLTQVDLLPPRGEWNPPYRPSDSRPKAEAIRKAMHATLEALELPPDAPSVAVAFPGDKAAWNISSVNQQIDALAEDASLAQLNRRRLDASSTDRSWRDPFTRLGRLGRAGGRRLLKRGGD